MWAKESRTVFPVLIGLVWIAIFFQDEWLGGRGYIFTSSIDNQDIILPLHLYFLDSIHHGHLDYLLPYLWSGTRLIGDPNFQLSPLHIIAAVALDSDRYLEFLSIWAFLVVCGSYIGVYRLLRVLLPERSPWLAVVGGLLYVFSTGFFTARNSTNTEFAFFAIPWIWYFLHSNRPEIAVRNTAWIAAILWFQFSYGQLQFSIYTAWLTLLFGLFVPDRRYRRLNLRTLSIAGICAAILASYYLIPVVDNLVMHGGGEADRLAGSQSLTEQIVRPIYLLRLLFPSLFGWQYPESGALGSAATTLGIMHHATIPWWPIWKDGWSNWESFSAYQGSLVTAIVLFGVVLLRGEWFWRAGYMALLLAVTTYGGAWLLCLMHLGVGVPYGRITVLLGLFVVVIFAKTLSRILETQRMQITFAIYLCVITMATFILSHVGLSKWLVQQTFEQASVEMGDFYAQHAGSFKTAIRNHGIFIFSAAALAVGCTVLMNILDRKEHVRIAKTALAVGLAGVALMDAVLFYDGGKSLNEQSSNARQMTFLPHAAEVVLAKDGVDFNRHRLHLDMPFAPHRTAVYEETAGVEASSFGLSRRWIPDRPILAHIAITGGYSSIIPDGARYAELLNWRLDASDLRAQGDYSILHPALFDVLAIRYVLRWKGGTTRDQGWRPAMIDPWERKFQKHAKLLYEDDAYRLYRYERATDVFYFPRRVIFTDSPVSSVTDRPEDHWETTGFLSRNVWQPREEKRSGKVNIQEYQVPGRVSKVRQEDNGWTLSLHIKNTAYLFAGLRYDSWWKVSVDGEPVIPMRANGVFMAIPIPGGDHAVAFKVVPMSAWVGMAISLIGLCSALLFLLSGYIFRK